MVFEFKFPDVGEGIHEGEIVKWLIKEGDFVKEDQELLEVQTDKAVVTIPSPRTGNILKINFKNGDTVKVGEVLVKIQESEKPLATNEAESIKENKTKGFAVVGQLEEAPDEEPFLEKLNVEETDKEENFVEEIPITHEDIIHLGEQTNLEDNLERKQKVLATPKVRSLAKEKNIDINSVIGTGKDGIILEKDILSFKTIQVKSSGIKVVKKYDFYGYVDRVPLNGLRKVIAENMIKSYSKAVHVTHMDFADITHLNKIREKEKLKLEKQGMKLTYLPFVIKTVTSALKEHPYLNSSLDEQTQEIILKKYYNIGIAVDTQDGLMVPVVKNADGKNIIELVKEISNLSKLARERKIDLSDLKGSTFTITNIGSIGGMYATPIINYPESAILALGKVQDSVLVKKGKIVIRKILPFSLTFDHRILDGAEAAKFANKIKEILEDPDSLLFE